MWTWSYTGLAARQIRFSRGGVEVTTRENYSPSDALTLCEYLNQRKDFK